MTGFWNNKVTALKEVIKKDQLTKNPVQSVCIHGDTDCVRCASLDLDNQTGDTAVWQALEEEDLKRIVYTLPSKVIELMRRHPSQVVVAGGFIRSIVASESVHDIDIFISLAKNAKDWCNEVGINGDERDKHIYVEPRDGHPSMEIIWRYSFKEPYEIPNQFDYTVAKAGIWFDEGNTKRKPNFIGICHERFYRDLARKMLVYSCDRDSERVESITRLLKYTRYGYSISPDNLAEAIARTCLSLDLTNGFEGMVDALKKSYQPTEAGKDWAELTKKYVKPRPERTYDYSSGS